VQNNESNQDRLESRGSDAQNGRGARYVTNPQNKTALFHGASLHINFHNRNQKGGRGYQPPPRHSEEHRNGRRTTSNSSAAYSQQNGAGHVQQSKPPRFQRNQELQHQYQHNGEREAHQRSSQTNDYRSTFSQSRASNAIAGDHGNDAYNKNQAESQGRNLGNRNSNHVEPEARNKHSHDASYGRHNRAQQDGASKVYSSNTSEKNFKNQLRYQPNNSVGSRMPVNLNAQRSENNYGNTNAASANVTWVWQVGDKCMAKYWEDNRVRIVFSYSTTVH